MPHTTLRTLHARLPWLLAMLAGPGLVACGGAMQASPRVAASQASYGYGSVSTSASTAYEPAAPPPPSASTDAFAGGTTRGAPATPLAHGTPARATDVVPAPEAGTAESPARMLIYTATVHMVVEATPAALDQAIEIATVGGGFLASRTDQSVQLRVPSARFRDVLARIEHLGDVSHREVQAEDISEQYHDLDVQLANLRAVRTRLQEFLARAANVQEALVVEHELERVGAQIDAIAGRMRFLASRAAFSTITLNVTQRPAVVAVVAPTLPLAPALRANLPFSWLNQLGLRPLLQH